MEIKFCKNNKGHEQVIELLNENHPEYDTVIEPCLEFCDKCKTNVFAKIGDDYYISADSKELYNQIVDHFFRIPSSFIG